MVTRFAPSPTGYLHIGHALSALAGWRRARRAGGRFLLRIEDIDHTRCSARFSAAIIEDLAWLGIDWDGDVLVQSARLPAYQARLDELRARGLLYPCFCTRADLAGHEIYPGTCCSLTRGECEARMAAGQIPAWRLDCGKAAREVGSLRYVEEREGLMSVAAERFGDVVLGRRDIGLSYHLCVVHDDADQGVTHVTRGDDLRASTPIHVMLQALFGLPVPVYAHHPLINDESGRKFSKSQAAPALRSLRQAGRAAAAILADIERMEC